MKKSQFLLLLSILFIYCVSGISCAKPNEPGPDIVKNIDLPQNGLAVAAAGNQFAFDFLHNALQDDPAQTNKLISPLSIYLALSMAYNGANNATRDSMKQALKLDNISIDDLNKTCKALIEQIPGADNKINISIANSIWYNQLKQPLQQFLNTTHDYYHATVSPLNFAANDAVNTINKWVADNTHQKITSILDKIDGNALMFLINAIYFKGNWQYLFDKKATRDLPFYLASNTTVSTPFMKLDGKGLNYFADNTMQVVQLPYGGGNFSMYVLLPVKGVSITQFASGIDAAFFQSLPSLLYKSDLNLFLPKFKYSYSIKDMKPALGKLGMNIAFTDQADFSKMYNVGAQITEAIHKTFIEIDETGTEAAAATSIGVGLTSAGPMSMYVDHPFMYIIAEKTSNTVLFTGIVNNPAEH
jgi:serine protease inhibitor